VNPEYAFPKDETPAGAAVDSAALVENANLWDKRIVTFTGEAIGEAMIRGQMAWIHLNDDPYMQKNVEEGAALAGYNSGHAIWLPADLARKIRYFGDYSHAGDIVKVTGIFNAASAEHGGDMDVHASSLEIVRVGHPVKHVIDDHRAVTASILLVIAGMLYGVQRRRS
jgi:hypothetical protein